MERLLYCPSKVSYVNLTNHLAHPIKPDPLIKIRRIEGNNPADSFSFFAQFLQNLKIWIFTINYLVPQIWIFSKATLIWVRNCEGEYIKKEKQTSESFLPLLSNHCEPPSLPVVFSGSDRTSVTTWREISSNLRFTCYGNFTFRLLLFVFCSKQNVCLFNHVL